MRRREDPERGVRKARVRALAKINLDLRVLGKRPDGYHEIRTVYQTITLADTLDLSFTPSRRTRIDVQSSVPIEENLVVKAARAVLEATGASGTVDIALEKTIPMGAGLGGGSSDAAAILLALPVLAARKIEWTRLLLLAEALGSDVPFFLLGGRALGIGRGSEIYPLPDLPPQSGLLVAGRRGISTAEAYRALPCLTTEDIQNKIVSFAENVWRKTPHQGQNDFEGVISRKFPEIAKDLRRLMASGPRSARITGSGSAIFGLFQARDKIRRAQTLFDSDRTFPFSFVGRSRYQAMWRAGLAPLLNDRSWPPQNRYAQ